MWLRTAFACVCLVTGVASCNSQEVAEPLLSDLPPGVYVASTTTLSAQQVESLSTKLGGKIRRITNSQVQIHGSPIQVNVIETAGESDAKSVHQSIAKFKSFPFLLKKENLVIEYVGQSLSDALAMKASYELGLIEKPNRVRYRVQADLATIEKADYMSCNPLFNQFLNHEKQPNKATESGVTELANKFEFGKTLQLRNSSLNPEATYRFDPEPLARTKENNGTERIEFPKTKDRLGVAYVSVDLELEVSNSGLTKTSRPPDSKLTEATSFWPSDDDEVIELAARICAGKKTNREKADAILKWLTPGTNIKYRGQTGSRYGTDQVLTQKFGHCWDFSDCFVTLARAAGIPSRQVAGWLYGSSGHVWAEYYVEGEGWQQVDPTGGGQLPCGIYHIPYFTSETGEMPIVYLSFPKISIVE